MAVIQERYTPYIITADTEFIITEQSIGGFLCTGDGTITVTDNLGKILLDAFPVITGSYYPLVMYVGQYGGFFNTTGATGTLLA